ncbi:unnamed protein product, partial [Meganyctiphanes norvegica]
MSGSSSSLGSQSSGRPISMSYIDPTLDHPDDGSSASTTPFIGQRGNLHNNETSAYYTTMANFGPSSTPSPMLLGSPHTPPASPSLALPHTPLPSRLPQLFTPVMDKRFDRGGRMSPKLVRRLSVEAKELRKQLGNVSNEVRNVTNEVLQQTTNAGKVIIAHTGEAGKVIKKQTEEAGKFIGDQAKQGIKILSEPIEIVEFGWFDILVGTISVGTFYFDVISDSLVAFYMYFDPTTEQWFLPTLLTLLIPLFIVNMMSLYWYWFDENICQTGRCPLMPRSSRSVWLIRILGHLFLHAHVFRYVDILFYGNRSKHKKDIIIETKANSCNACENGGYEAPDQATMQYTDNVVQVNLEVEPPKDAFHRLSPVEEMHLWIHAERDSCNVDILSSLIQDAPQLILQLHILSFTLPQQAQTGDISTTLIMQLVSVCGSLIAMAWSVTSYRRSVRMSEPTMGNLSPAGLIVLTLTHFCSIAPQVLCFALFMTRFLWPFLVAVFGHWLLMTALVLCQLSCFSRYIDPVRIRATFSHDVDHGPCAGLDDIFFSISLALAILEMQLVDTKKKKEMEKYNISNLLDIQRVELFVLEYIYTEDSWYHILPIIVTAGLAVAGVMFLAIYLYLVNPDSAKDNAGPETEYQNSVGKEPKQSEEEYQISTVSGSFEGGRNFF